MTPQRTRFLCDILFTLDGEAFEKQVVLIDERPKFIESLGAEGFIVGQDLHIYAFTSP